jgi:hypothetical protein
MTFFSRMCAGVGSLSTARDMVADNPWISVWLKVPPELGLRNIVFVGGIATLAIALLRHPNWEDADGCSRQASQLS